MNSHSISQRALPMSMSLSPSPDEDDGNDHDNDNDGDTELAKEALALINQSVVVVNQGTDDQESLPQRLSLLLLLTVNVVAWYAANSLNGVAMQSFASRIRQQYSSTQSADFLPLPFIFTVTVSVTTLQLLLGGSLGMALLTINSARSSHFQLLWSRQSLLSHLFLAFLHAIGSLFTNLGFLYASASLIQILKLLEPFETLLWTSLFVQKTSSERRILTTGVLSSMTLTVGAALELVQAQAQSKPPPPTAILFAILSGLTLSIRNVLQRKWLPSTPCHWKLGQKEPFSQYPKHGHLFPPKLQKALTQFTDISLTSGLLLLICLLVTNVTSTVHSQQFMIESLWRACDWRVFLWHPLYNVFSMVTLAFCSAVTHSLLNAGKRVVAISFAIFWFSEPFSVANAVSLAFVTVGGCWYSAETKNGHFGTFRNDYKVFHLIFVIILLGFLHCWKSRPT